MDIIKIKRLAGIPTTVSDYKLKESFKKSITENEEMEHQDSSEKKESDVVSCPICDAKMVESDFYKHCMMDHKNEMESLKSKESTEDEKSDEESMSDNSKESKDDEISFEISTDEPNNTTQTESEEISEDAIPATVWDTTDDKDESPSAYPEDATPIKVPADIINSLSKEIDELKATATSIERSDYLTAEFYVNCADAMTDIKTHLERGDFYGIQMAQVCLTKYMSPIVQKIPAKVVDYIVRGGKVQSVSELFRKIK